MSPRKTLLPLALTTLFALPALAQTTGSTVQRDVNQQQRIEQGLQSGALTTREAGRLEHEEVNVERMQKNALKDGSLSPAEQANLQRAQNKVSNDVYRAKHNARTGDPNSASSQRMQADVQRNVKQQERIEQGVQSGALTNHEVAKLEGGQAQVDRKEARAAADGHVGPVEQRRIQRAENRQSRHIYKQKHDAQTK